MIAEPFMTCAGKAAIHRPHSASPAKVTACFASGPVLTHTCARSTEKLLYNASTMDGLPFVCVGDALDVAIGMVDANGSIRHSVWAGIKAEKVGRELVWNGRLDVQEKNVCFAVIEHQPHPLEYYTSFVRACGFTSRARIQYLVDVEELSLSFSTYNVASDRYPQDLQYWCMVYVHPQWHCCL